MTAYAQQNSTPQTNSENSSGSGPRRFDFRAFAALLAPLALILLVAYRYQLESPAFLKVLALAVGGFAVHYFLPLRHRLPFFLVLSFIGIAVTLGPGLGASVIGIGLGLIGICHLPVSYRARVATLVVVTGGLALIRAGVVTTPWPVEIWPVLGAIFMFRLVVYLLEIRHEKQPAPISQRLAYFFLLPNPVFPLFPVVDYTTFRHTYAEAGKRLDTYAVGVTWIVRGFVHLLLYRVVYYYLLMPVTSVQDLGDLIRYVTSGYLAYLRISGQFHVIVGILHLFGFNLPRTNRNYFMATSFTDFWRRINIYWKDFMMKFFFNPLFMRLRKLGTTQGLVVATMATLIISWLLHSYQWFWLRGTFPLTVQDAVFWGTFGIAMAASTVYEMKFGRQRSLTKPKITWQTIAARALKAGVMFATISTLWSFWTTEDVPAWFDMWQAAGNVNVDSKTLALLVGGGLFFVVAVAITSIREGAANEELPFAFYGTMAAAALLLTGLCVLSVPAVQVSLGPTLGTVIGNLRLTKLNRLDTQNMERGYYENLLAVDNFNSRLWEIYQKRPGDWLDQVVGSARNTGDFVLRELNPSAEYWGGRVLVRTNSWGMRDREYEKTPPDGTYRMAIMGTSYVMGKGVEKEKIFESLIEARLNSERPFGTYENYEVLNFGASGFKPLQQLFMLENKVLEFEPDIVLYVAHSADPHSAARHLVEVVRAGIEIPYPYLRDLLTRARIDATTSETVALRRLEPYYDELIEWTYVRFAEICRQGNAVPVWVFLPTTKDDLREDLVPTLELVATEAGFVTITLSDVYGDHDQSEVTLEEWDFHPNDLGHRLIAERLYQAIVENEVLETSPRP